MSMKHDLTPEEQSALIERERIQCLPSQTANLTTNASDAVGGYCLQVWDGIMCWPSTPAGILFEQPCAEYIFGFNHKSNASKYCTSCGEWFHDETTNTFWTNYTQCYSAPVLTVPVNFTGMLNGNLLITDYVTVLKTMAQVGYTVSLISLVIAFTILATIKKLRCPRNMLHLHLFVSFIMRASMAIIKDMAFENGVGLNQEVIEKNGSSYLLDQNNWMCKAVTSVWQYSIMANYSWILMEGLYLHNLIFLALFSDTSSISLYVILGWGLPLLFVLLWVVTRALLEDTLCWTTNGMYLLFLLLIRGPTSLSILLNFLLFLKIVRVLLLKLRASVSEGTRTYRRWAKSTLVLVPLFGVHYAVFLGMGMVSHPHVEIAWLFCDQLFASFQGFFVAVLYCFMNGEVRSELKRHWPRSGSIRVGKGGGRGGFFNRPVRPARCYSSTSCTSLSMATAGTGGCLSRKLRQTGVNGAQHLSTSFVCPESHYSCGPNVRSSLEDISNISESLLSYHNLSSA